MHARCQFCVSSPLCARQERVFCCHGVDAPSGSLGLAVSACALLVLALPRGLTPAWPSSWGDQPRENHSRCLSEGTPPGPRPEAGSWQGEPSCLHCVWASPVRSRSPSRSPPHRLHSYSISYDPVRFPAETELVFWLIGIRGNPCACRALSWAAERMGKEFCLWFSPVSCLEPRGQGAWLTASSYHLHLTGWRFIHLFPFFPPRSPAGCSW